MGSETQSDCHMTLTLDVILKISQVNSVCQPCNSIAKQAGA